MPQTQPKIAPAPIAQPEKAGLPDQRRLMSQFNVALSLMSVIPLLICLYLIVETVASFDIFAKLPGVYFLFAILIALLGLLFGRLVIREVVTRLVEANARLRHLYAQQAGFVGNMSHEFRAPLTVVKGSLDNLADGLHGVLSADQLEPVLMCQKEVNRLKRLVADLLDLSRIEAGKLPMLQQSIDLRETLQSIGQFYGQQSKEHGIPLVLELPEGVVMMTGDADRLKQVFVNLIGNAMKFTQAGHITVKLSTRDAVHQVEILDTGRGIPPEDLERIFDKFVRIGDETEEGSGLGLPIARDIVVLHHGKIWAESQVGQGSRFVVQLPQSGNAPADR